MKIKPRIAIFQPHPDTYTNPTLVNFFKRLAALDFDIDLYTAPVSKQKSVFLQEELFHFPAYPILKIVWGDSREVYLRSIMNLPDNIKFHAGLGKKKYDLVFAIDPDGLIAARQLVKKNPTPLFYFSFEIFFRHELHGREKKIKRREIEASRFIDWVIIQDEQRWELLKRENKIAHNNIIYMPVAPAGPAERKKTAFLREKLGIPQDKKVVLFSQGIGDWIHVKELVEQAHIWPSSFILVIHSRNFVSNTKFLENAAKCDPSRVRFDFEPVPFDKLSELVGSADIGLVLRKPTHNKYNGDNIRYVGLSSGTFSTYMKHGLPVISNNEQSHKDILLKHGCGIYIKEFSEIAGALQRIDSNYEAMRNSCFTFFEDVLSFDNHYEQLMSTIMSYLSAQVKFKPVPDATEGDRA